MPAKNSKKTTKPKKKPDAGKSELELQHKLAQETNELAKELKKLAKEVHRLKELEFIQILKHPWKLMGYSFLKGAMVGFGSIVGAGILIAVFFYLVSQISLVPVIGEFVQEVVGQLDLPENVDNSATEQ